MDESERPVPEPQGRPDPKAPAPVRGESLAVLPLRDIVVERALHVIATAVGRAHGAERESALVISVDKFFRSGRRFR